jgi:hypothetical protein
MGVSRIHSSCSGEILLSAPTVNNTPASKIFHRVRLNPTCPYQPVGVPLHDLTFVQNPLCSPVKGKDSPIQQSRAAQSDI